MYDMDIDLKYGLELPEPVRPILKGAKCYLSGPIEHGSGPNWRTEPTKVLTKRFGINVFDPFEDPKQKWLPHLLRAREEKNYAAMQTIAERFVRKDLTLVDKSDILIAYLPKGVPTTGTHHEIIFNDDNKNPTILMCPQGKEQIPAWYYGFIPHEVMFGSWEEVYNYLEEVEDCKHVDNRRWHYVYGVI